MSESESVPCILFHGPTAQGRVAEAAQAWGRVLRTYGDPREGLDTETVREAVEMLSAPSVGDGRGAIVIGPVDVLTKAEVVDALLKVVEESNPRLPRPYLWAWDGGSVRPTIRSRCLMEWCPGMVILDRKIVEIARSVVESSLAGSVAGVLDSMSELRGESGGGKEWSMKADDFLLATAQVLALRPGHAHLNLWVSLRPLMVSYSSPTYGEIVSGFLP